MLFFDLNENKYECGCSSQHRLVYNKDFYNDNQWIANQIILILRTPSIDTKNRDIYERIPSNHMKYKTCVLLRNSATKEFN